MPKPTKDGKYAVDLRPLGMDGPRFRRKFNKKSEALAFERKVRMEHPQQSSPESKEIRNRLLSEQVDRWYTLYGSQLTSGETRYNYMINLCNLWGDPVASKITANSVAEFRTTRLEKVCKNTANHDLAYLKAMSYELIRLNEWTGENPFAKVRRLKCKNPEMAYLEEEQWKKLLACLELYDSHAHITAKVCLATGARWSEASTLKASQVRKGRVIFRETKNGKDRTLPISPTIEKLLRNNVPLVDGYSTIKRAIKDDLDLELPKGQLSHVLRHSFAAHYMMNGGNILTLQKVLDHESINTTMRYAHFAPDHLTSVLLLNPFDYQAPSNDANVIRSDGEQMAG